jgi:hypothetical protein
MAVTGLFAPNARPLRLVVPAPTPPPLSDGAAEPEPVRTRRPLPSAVCFQRAGQEHSCRHHAPELDQAGVRGKDHRATRVICPAGCRVAFE